ncbi:hypothetical protein FXO38_04135 [Capsicum annuum]|nr:hypothetical protein FXO37_05981 [Capsicum annuum]KAF3676744.1 hypothetical protein FXO38_04135 [Capsicum annuum]
MPQISIVSIPNITMIEVGMTMMFRTMNDAAYMEENVSLSNDVLENGIDPIGNDLSDNLVLSIAKLYNSELNPSVGLVWVNPASGSYPKGLRVRSGLGVGLKRRGGGRVGLDEEENKIFWEVLDEVVRGLPSLEKIFIGADFNGHIRALLIGYGDVH